MHVHEDQLSVQPHFYTRRPVLHRPAAGKVINRFFAQLAEQLGESHGPTFFLPRGSEGYAALNQLENRDICNKNVRDLIMRPLRDPTVYKETQSRVPTIVQPMTGVSIEAATIDRVTKHGSTVIDLLVSSDAVRTEHVALQKATSELLIDPDYTMQWAERPAKIQAVYIAPHATDLQIFDTYQWVQEHLPLNGVTLQPVPEPK